MLPRRDHNPLWPSAVAAMRSLLVGGSVWNFSWRGQAHHLLGRSRFRALFITRLQVVARDLVHSKSCTYALWTHRVWHAKTDGTVGMGWGAVRMEWGAMGMGKTPWPGPLQSRPRWHKRSSPKGSGLLGVPGVSRWSIRAQSKPDVASKVRPMCRALLLSLLASDWHGIA